MPEVPTHEMSTYWGAYAPVGRSQSDPVAARLRRRQSALEQ